MFFSLSYLVITIMALASLLVDVTTGFTTVPTSNRFGGTTIRQDPLRATTGNDAAKPFGVIVKAEIQPDRMAEFLLLIEKNAIETRKEPGCLRFDVLRSAEAPNQFYFYELYKNPAAIDYHKQQPHYYLWANFKESGGTIDSTTFKMDGEFIS